MKANELFNLDEMAMGIGKRGLDYENTVLAAIQTANVPGLKLTKLGAAGTSAADLADIEATWNGKPFYIECKSARSDTMGSFSMIYNKQQGTFTPSPTATKTGKVEEEDIIIGQQACLNKKDAIDAYLEELATREPLELHKDALLGIPFKAEYNTREKMVQDGYQRAIQQMISASSNFITNMYNSKDVYYIQVGGAGLFYMGTDVLGLGVPRFEGEVKMEVRFKPAGDTSGSVSRAASKKVGYEIQARNVMLICGGKIITKSNSPYTLDDPESIRTLFDQ